MMPKRPGNAKETRARKDRVSQPARASLEEIEKIVRENPGKNPAAVALGRKGGKVGGKARMNSLTPEQRSELALKAARARWGK